MQKVLYNKYDHGKNRSAVAAWRTCSLCLAHVIIVYLPNTDKEGQEFDVENWDTEALKLLGRLFQGATSYPSRGSYRKSDKSGTIIEEEVMLEQTRMITSFVMEDDFTETKMKQIANFLYRFKNETKQQEVALVVDGEMYYL